MRKILLISDAEPDGMAESLGRWGAVEIAPLSDGGPAYGRILPDAVVIRAADPAAALGALSEVKSVDRRASIVVVTPFLEMEAAVEFVKSGAFDCLSSSADTADMERTLAKVFRTIDLHSRLADLSVEAAGFRGDSIVGRSPAMEEIFKAIGAASQTKVTVLIQGESGTGKELIARAIHCNSPERAMPFVAINCSALVETLLESELFGHEKGAFTGALFRKEGKFEAASGGTVFLDEIGEMSPALQVKLLRVLQERSFERVGGSETIKTDVRVIAATNRDLNSLVSEGSFRGDLFYRLKVMTIDVPPLRERKMDIPLLAAHLLEKAGRELHKSVRKVPEDVMARLVEYPWPGNVRELENVITRGVLMAKGDVLMDVFLPGGRDAEGTEPWAPAPLAEVERAHIERTLGHAGWNKSRAALMLGISLPRLERKIRKYSIARR